MEYSKKIINSLKRLGEGNKILDIDRDLFLPFYPYSLYQLDSFINFEMLDDQTLLLVFVGLVRIEIEMKFRQGSTTPVWRIYAIIEQRRLDPHLLYANWAFQYADNEYIPFGFGNRKGCLTAFEYKSYPVPNIDEDITNPTEFSDHERRFVYSGLVCPYCGNATKQIDSAEIYHGISYGIIYLCKPCNAYVGCHKGTTLSMGRLANSDLREAKKRAHHYLDQLWQPKVYNRPIVYKWLSESLGINQDFTHIGMSNLKQCEKIIALSIQRMKEIGKVPIPYTNVDG